MCTRRLIGGGVVGALAALALINAGCGIFDTLPVPPELAGQMESVRIQGSLPAPLDWVMQHKETFGQGDDPFGGAAPGTVMDDLSGLTGCWGSYELEDPFPGAVPPIGIYEVYHFDDATKQFTRWVYTDGVLMMPAIYATDSGTYELLDGGRINCHPDTYSAYDMSTRLGRKIDNPPEGYFEGELYLTLKGDRLNTADSLEPDESGEIYRQLFRRFDCP